MKNKSPFSLLLIGVLLLFLFSCKKEKPATIPTVTIISMTNIAANSASSGGGITSDGGTTVTARGVCWSTNHNPSTMDNKTNDGSGFGSFTSSITGLTANVTYYIRAYAINAEGTSYSKEISFITLSGLPTLTTTIASSITFKSAISGGNITSEGSQSVYKSGVCWSTSPSPTIENDKTDDGGDVGSFTSYIWELSPLTTYYIRAYATSWAGTGYGNEITMTTLDAEPTLFSKTTIQYGSNWNMTEEVNCKWDLNAKDWVIYSKIAYSYDSQGRKTQSISSLWDEPTKRWINDTKRTSLIFAFGKMWGGLTYQWNSAIQDWEQTQKDDIFGIDNNSFLVTLYSWNTYHYGWNEYYRYMCVFTFDNNERIRQQTTTEYDEAQYGYYGKMSRIIFTYDSKGNVIESEYSGWDKTYGWSYPGYYVVFTYDINGNPTKKLKYESNSIVSEKIIYTYNASGNQIEYIVYRN